MSFVEPSSAKPGDDLDNLLRTFFRSQMPHPWPSPPLPRLRVAPPTRPMSSGRSLIRSRWALAASIGLLLVGSLFLPGRLTSNDLPDRDSTLRYDANDFQRKQMKMEQEMKKFQEKHNKVPDMKEDGQIGSLDDSDLSSIK